jgi:hypothetical protein
MGDAGVPISPWDLPASQNQSNTGYWNPVATPTQGFNWNNLISAGSAAFPSLFPSTTNTNQSGTQNISSNQNTNFNQNTSGSQSQNYQNYGTSNQTGAFNTSGQSTNTGTSTGTTTGTQSGFVTGGYAAPGAATLSDQLARQYASLASKAPDLSGYLASQTSGINRNTALLDQAQQASLAARGLSTSPVAGSVAAQTQANRVGQITNLQEQIPLLSNQLALANMASAGGYLASAPRTQANLGTTTGTQTGSTQQVGTTQQAGTQTQAGTTTGGGQSSGQSSQATTGSQQSTGTQDTTTNVQQQQKKGGGFGNFLSGFAGALATLL